MASPFDAAGAEHIGSGFAPLSMDRYITGLVTNRSPLRDAAVPYLYAKFYQAGRFDSLIDGLNMELTARLTLARRPGLSVYNSQTFAPIRRFYEFRQQVDSTPRIRMMVDTDAAVYDGTGPSGKTLIFTKSAGAGRTSFQSVGNTLYMANGVDAVKYTVSTKSYKASALYNAGDFINDPNGNIQVAFAFTSAQVTESGVSAGARPTGSRPVYDRLNLVFQTTIPFTVGQQIMMAGLGVAAAFNGYTGTYTGGLGTVASPATFVMEVAASGPQSLQTDTGVATGGGSGSGLSGTTAASAPTWPTTPGAVITDGTVVWICKGSQVQKWGSAAPTAAPSITQAAAPNPYGTWAASTYYSPNLLAYNSSAPGVQYWLLIQAGTTGTSEPALYSEVANATETDGTAKWQHVPTTWTAGANDILGTLVVNTVAGTPYAFQCVVAGTTGSATPAWLPTFGAEVSDGTCVWSNVGPVVEWGAIGVSTLVTLNQTILDPGGFEQAVEIGGLSGATQPSIWSETLTQLTTDDAITWVNAGPFAVASTAQIGYAFSYASSVTYTETNVSPLTYISRRALRSPLIQGMGSSDVQMDTVVIYRTVDGGSTLLFDDQVSIPQGSPSSVWSFYDTGTDADLNIEIQGVINDTNDPPPAGLTSLGYHMSRICGAVGPLLYFTQAPNATTGNALEAWTPANVFALPGIVARSVPWDLPDGVLFVFTDAGPYAIWGTGTASDPFYSKPYPQGGGLLSYDELAIGQGTIYQFTSDRRLMSFQPSAGYVSGTNTTADAGAPIGDQFIEVTTGGINASLYTPGATYLTWHAYGTNDVGLFAADGTRGWFRYAQVTQPEEGWLWSPFAGIANGTSAVQSVETAPGVRQLLVGPQASGPILARDTTTSLDNGAAFAGYSTLGSIQLCAPTETAELVGVVIDSKRVGTSPGVAILLSEIAATINHPFLALERTGNDPPNLPPSETVASDYFAALQSGQTNQCRHMQIMISLIAENAANEILGHAVYGRHIPMRREM